jgi:hypothetical protein
VSVSGLLASIVIYIASYRGATMDGIARWAIVLHLGIVVLLLPMYAVEYSTVRQRTFFWKGSREVCQDGSFLASNCLGCSSPFTLFCS